MNLLKNHSTSIFTVLLVFLLTPVFAYAQDFTGGVQNMIWIFVNNVFGFFVGAGGLLLDIGINKFVIGFGKNFLGDGVGFTVDRLWENIRDIFNLTFIFGLVYIGFKMILDSDDSGTKKWLVNIIIAALLVNFSLYITKLVVDVTNILATEIANGAFTSDGGELNVSRTFMSQFGLTSAWGGGGDGLEEALRGTSGAWAYIMGTAIIFMVAAFVFAAGGILLIIRYAVLSVYMVLSPLMFIGLVFPNMRDVSSKYWRGFLGKAFFAPVYLLMLYFSAQIIESFYDKGSPNFQAALSGSGDAVQANFSSTIPPFILSCVFLILALVVANKLGAEGASKFVSLGSSASRATGRWAVRNTAGYGARVINKAGEGVGRQYSRIDASLSRTKTGRYIRAGANVVGLSNKNVQAAVAATSRASIAGSETAAQVRERAQNRQKSNNEMMKQQDREKNTTEQMTIINAIDPNTTDPNQKAALKAAQQALASSVTRMSNEELELMSRTKEGRETLNSAAFAAHLSDAQLKAVTESGNLNNDQIKALGDARNTGTLNSTTDVLDDLESEAGQLNKAFEDLGKTIRGMSNERANSLGIDNLKSSRIAMNLTDSQIDHISQSGSYTAAEVNEIKEARKKGFEAVAAGNLSDAGIVNKDNEKLKNDPDEQKKMVRTQRQNLMSRSTQQAGNLPVEVFMDPDMTEFIPPQALEERMKNGNISQAQLDTIKGRIVAYASDPAITDAQRNTFEKKWQNWSERSTYGASLGLSFP